MANTALKLARAVGLHRKAKDAERQARERLYAMMAAARDAGMPQREIVELTGYTREQVRRICRDAGVGALNGTSGHGRPQ